MGSRRHLWACSRTKLFCFGIGRQRARIVAQLLAHLAAAIIRAAAIGTQLGTCDVPCAVNFGNRQGPGSATGIERSRAWDLGELRRHASEYIVNRMSSIAKCSSAR